MNVLLTGAGSGVGQAVADALHGRGDDLVLLARNAERAADIRGRYDGVDVRVADLSDPGRVAAAVDGVDVLDAVVHAAGVLELGPIGELPLEHLTDQLQVNLVSPTELTRALLPALRATRGTVVFLNSGAGLAANPEWGAYAASKAGLKSIADALREEEAGAGIRVTSVYLGRFATPMQSKVHAQEGQEYHPEDWGTPESAAASILHVLDLPRDVTIEDIRVRPAPR